jgi:hypothetical protein
MTQPELLVPRARAFPPSHEGAVVSPIAGDASDHAWRKFTKSFFIVVAIGLISLAAFNFIINPMDYYPPRIVPPAVWDARDIKTRLLSTVRPKPRILILGSSRAMKLDPALVTQITGEPAFNATVESAMAEDYYAMLRYAVEQKGIDPKLVIIGIDLESFHNHTATDGRLLMSGSLRRYLKGENRKIPWKEFTMLFTASQTYYSIVCLQHALSGVPPEESTRFDSNGYLHYVKWEAERQTGHYDLEGKFEKTRADYISRFDRFTGVSPDRLDYLRRTLEYCRAHHIAVRLYITPISPGLAESLRPYGYFQRRQEVITAVRSLLQPGEKLYDFSDIASFSGNPAHFFDAAHIDERNSALLTQQLLRP